LPFAFPYAGLFATGNRGTSGYNAAMNVRIASRTHISIQNWSPSGEGTEDCCFIGKRRLSTVWQILKFLRE
ncbi:hypothetical protein ABNA88_004630, partial [Escherichia coli]